MIVAFVNQKGGVGKTTLALHLAGRWAGKRKRVVVVDADPQGSALDWSEQRAREGVARLFGVLGLPRETLHRELPAIAADADHVIVDGAPRIAGVARSALLRAHAYAGDRAVRHLCVKPQGFGGGSNTKLTSDVQTRRVASLDTARGRG